MSKRQIVGLVSFGVGILFVIGIFFSAIHYVDPGYVAVIQSKTNGKIRVVPQVGWTFVNPFTEKATEYPVSTEMLILTKNNNEGSDADDSIDTPTKEGQNINVDASLAYRVNDVEKLYRKYRGADIETITQKVIRNTLNNELMAVTAKFSILEVNDARDQITVTVLERIKKSLALEGITAEKFNLRSIRLPESVKASFDTKVTAENSIRQAESKLKQARIEAEIKLTQAKAEADANRLVQSSLTPMLIEKLRIEKLNPNVEVIYTPNNANLFINKSGK
jgi:regulator of protease activity HflC (stomatin/prohibitin superfamily)